MLISLSYKDALIVEPRDLEVALQLLGEVEGPMEIALRGIGRNKLNADMERILADIKRQPDKSMPIKQLIAANKFQLRDDEFYECIRVLASCGFITELLRIDPNTNTQTKWIKYVED